MGTVNLTDVLNGEDTITIEDIVRGLDLNDLANVLTTMSPIDGQVLTYDSTNGWQAEATAESSTELSEGTRTATTYGITSDGGIDDIELPEANTTEAGLLGADKWDEIVANSLKDTNIPTELSEGTRTATTYGITSDGGTDDLLLPEADTTNAGLLGADKWDEVVASTEHLTDSTAHAAEEITFSASGFVATDVKNGIIELDDEKQASAGALTNISTLTPSANKGIRFTGLTTSELFDLTDAGKAILDDVDASAQRTTLGLVIGTNVQAYDSDTVKYDVAGSFTESQRSIFVTTEDMSISFNSGNNLSFTATATAISVTDQTAGQSGTLVIATANLITGWGTEFDWGYQGVPTDLTGTETFGYTISGASGADSIIIGRV